MYKSIDLSSVCYLLMPSIVTLVTTKKPNGGFNVMTAAWVMPLSRNPPLIAIAISPKRYTYECLRYHKEFTVSIIPPEMKDLSWYCGTISGRFVDKVKEKGIEFVKLSKVEVPGIKGALAIIGCKLWSDYDGGDHRIIVGEVVEVLVKEGVFEETWRNVELLYYYGNGKYLSIKIP